MNEHNGKCNDMPDKPSNDNSTCCCGDKSQTNNTPPPPPPSENGAHGRSGDVPMVDLHTKCHFENRTECAAPPHLPVTPLILINEISKLFRDRIRDENMQNSYRMLLFHLAMRGGRTQLELANITHLKPPTISVTLKKMEADGYVKRVPNERDMRQTLVYLTEKGEEYNKNMRKKIDMIDKQVASGFTEEEMQTLISMLIRMRDNIKHHDDRHPPQPAE